MNGFDKLCMERMHGPSCLVVYCVSFIVGIIMDWNWMVGWMDGRLTGQSEMERISF